MLRLIDRFADLPAVVISAKGDVLAWNAMASALHGDWSAVRPERRNMNLLRFLPSEDDPPRHEVGVGDEAERLSTASTAVASLRTACARYPDDPTMVALVHQLRSGSAEFARLWEEGGAGGWRNATKTVVHPSLGRLVLDCETLLVPDADQLVVVYSAAPGTPAAEALALLRVIGTQELLSPLVSP